MSIFKANKTHRNMTILMKIRLNTKSFYQGFYQIMAIMAFTK